MRNGYQLLKETTASFFRIEYAFSALKMEAVCYSKMVVLIYQTRRRKQPRQPRIRNINTTVRTLISQIKIYTERKEI